jgi:hypothetical protein
MVYCTKCGVRNPDDSEYCTSCGAALYLRAQENVSDSSDCFGGDRDWDTECFGLRRGGALFALVLGLLIIVAGVSALIGESLLQWIAPFFVIGIGLIIIVGILRRGQS